MTAEIKYRTKPHPTGKVYTGAKSTLEVLLRTRAVLSPRGAWRKGGLSGHCKLGPTRCLRQAMSDSDGAHVQKAGGLVLQAAKELGFGSYGTIPEFNDAAKTKKHHVIQALDRAIEKATHTLGGAT